jgi:hypothetical protein
MLSNLTANGGAAMQTILLGQPQFRKMLASPDLDQLRQRVLASYHLGPLTREETRSYIEHRMATAGGTGKPHWEDSAFDAIFRHSDGIPRRINRLCSRLLMHGALDEASDITVDMVETTAEELAQDLRGMESSDGAVTLAAPRGIDHANGHINGHDETRTTLQPLTDAEARSLSSMAFRLEALEDRVGRRERLFQKLAEIFSSDHGR